MNGIEGNFEKRNQGCFIVENFCEVMRHAGASLLSSIDCGSTFSIFYCIIMFECGCLCL